METVKADEDGLARAAAALNNGAVAVIPTDTVYGLAAHPRFPGAVRRLYAIKGREEAKPVALLASSAEAAGPYIGPKAAEFAAPHWPGALTVVARGEGVRVPDHAWARRLIAACGGTLRVTSANLSGRKEATDAAAALADVGLEADIVVDGGVSPGGVPSTVVGIGENGDVRVLREGAVKL